MFYWISNVAQPHIKSSLLAQVGGHDKLLEEAFGEDVRVAFLPDVVGGHEDVLSPEVAVMARTCQSILLVTRL